MSTLTVEKRKPSNAARRRRSTDASPTLSSARACQPTGDNDCPSGNRRGEHAQGQLAGCGLPLLKVWWGHNQGRIVLTASDENDNLLIERKAVANCAKNRRSSSIAGTNRSQWSKHLLICQATDCESNFTRWTRSRASILVWTIRSQSLETGNSKGDVRRTRPRTTRR